MTNKPAVLITGARSIVALHMARSFASAGYRVHMADCSSALVARMSKAPEHVHRYTAPRKDLARFGYDIQKIIKAINPAIIIPTCEEVFYLASPQLKGIVGSKLFAPPFETLKTLHAKDIFISVCAELGLPAPQTHILRDKEHLHTLCRDPAQWVFKQRYSRFGAKTLVAPKTHSLNMLHFDPANPWLAQQRIHGQEFSFYAIAKDGHLVAIAPYKSNWRLPGGASYVFTPVDTVLSKKIELFAEKIAAGMKINGQFSCDVIVDRDGMIWPLECNPRATSGLHLLPVNAHVAAHLEQHPQGPYKASSETCLQLATFATYGLSAAIVGMRMGEWVKTILQSRDVIGVKNDRWPILGALIDALIFKYHAIKENISLAQSTTSDIEWNGEQLS